MGRRTLATAHLVAIWDGIDATNQLKRPRPSQRNPQS